MENRIKPTWILLARRSGATIFSTHGAGTPLTVVHEVEHAAGRLKAGDIETDRPGRSFDRGGQGRHALSSDESPTEHLDRRFAAELAHMLDHARHLGEFNELVLVAAPRFLGQLRAELPASTQALVIGEVAKDLIEPDERELRAQLTGIVRI